MIIMIISMNTLYQIICRYEFWFIRSLYNLRDISLTMLSGSIRNFIVIGSCNSYFQVGSINHSCCCHIFPCSWWRHQVETCSVLQAFCEGNPTVTGGFRALVLSLIYAWTNGWAKNRDAGCTINPGYWQICVEYILTKSAALPDHEEVKMELMLVNIKDYILPLTSTIILHKVLISPDIPWHDDVIKWKPFPRYWPFVRGIHRSPVNSPHKGQSRGALMFTLICARINGWVNNR